LTPHLRPVGFTHILGDAVEGLSSECLGWPDFPWAMTVATFAALITFTFEWHLHKYFTSAFLTHSAPVEGTVSHRHDDVAAGHDVVVVAPAQISSTKSELADEKAAELQRITYSVQSCTLELGIVFHSIFIGISLGLDTDRASVQSLMIALMFHQLNEGLAIGITFIQVRRRSERGGFALRDANATDAPCPSCRRSTASSATASSARRSC